MKQEENEKLKRRRSLITTFLISFILISVFVLTVVLLSNGRHKNALEVTDNNWNISISMYDRSSETPNQAMTDLIWNATNKSEVKTLCNQINYICTTGKEYQPEEIIIEINGFNGYGSELNKNYNPVPLISADKESDTEKKYDWSYSYNN